MDFSEDILVEMKGITETEFPVLKLKISLDGL